MARSQPWNATLLPDKTTHEDWLRQNSSRYTKVQIAEALGRSLPSVDQKLRREGLMSADDVTVQFGNGVEEVEGIPKDALLKAIKDKPKGLDDLSLEFNRSTDTVRKALEQLQAQKYEIIQTEGRKYLWSTETTKIVAPPTILWDKSTTEFKLGVMGDTHDGSTAAQISARNKAINLMYDRGVREVIVAGDINAGRDVYRGQSVDLVTSEADKQAAITTTYWPRKDGMRFHMMGGNHDHSFLRLSGHNTLEAICDKREDFFYWGFDLVTIPIIKGAVDALVWHPKGSPSYALSYKPQKMVASVAFQELMEVLQKSATPKVRFLFVGHWHQMLAFWQGPIFVAMVGCFEGQTNHLKALGLYPQIGALILEASVTEDQALIRDLNISFLQFTEIEEDHLNYPVPRHDRDHRVESLFQWDGKYPGEKRGV